MWPKPEVQKLPQPKPMKFWNWIIILLFSFICSLLCALFLFPEKMPETALTFSLIIAMMTLLSTGLLFSIRIYLYGLAEEKARLWDDEIENIDQAWQCWSMRSLAVLSSVTLTPNSISAGELYEQQELPIVGNEALSFYESDDQFYLHAFESIFFDLKGALQQIQSDREIVIFLLGEGRDKTALEKIIKKTYMALNLEHRIRLFYPSDNDNQRSVINNLIDNPKEEVYLIVANSREDKQCSEFISAQLVVHEQFLRRLKDIKLNSHILRTMVSSPNETEASIQQLCDIQPAFRRIKHIWSSQLDEIDNVRLRIRLAELNKGEELSNSPIGYPLDSYLGRPNFQLSYWLLLAFACCAAEKSGESHLVAAKVGENTLFSVVTPTISYEGYRE